MARELNPNHHSAQHNILHCTITSLTSFITKTPYFTPSSIFVQHEGSNFCTSLLLAASSLLAGAAASALVPRSELYSSMEDTEPKIGTTLDTIYTDALDTCISLNAFGKTGTLSNRKVMVHIQATQQHDKTNKFIRDVSSTGYEQGKLRITVTGPSEDYVKKKMDIDEDFKKDVEAVPGGADGLNNVLEALINDAIEKATEAVKNAGGEDSDVVFVRRAAPDDDDIDDGDRGSVSISKTGKITVEGKELDDDGELDD